MVAGEGIEPPPPACRAGELPLFRTRGGCPGRTRTCSLPVNSRTHCHCATGQWSPAEAVASRPAGRERVFDCQRPTNNWCQGPVSTRRPPRLRRGALPTELPRRGHTSPAPPRGGSSSSDLGLLLGAGPKTKRPGTSRRPAFRHKTTRILGAGHSNIADEIAHPRKGLAMQPGLRVRAAPSTCGWRRA